MRKTTDELLLQPYRIVDALPERVPAGGKGQYFAVEGFILETGRMKRIKERHLDLILGLNCYLDLYLEEETEPNPPPERIARAVLERHVDLRLGETLVVSDPQESWLTLYAPEERLLELAEKLALAAGLFLWDEERSGPSPAP